MTTTAAAAVDATPRFTGFPDEAIGFFDGLEADNSKAYWADRKVVYERAVREPMLALLAALEAEFGAAKLFRPYRDVRFSADKSPYKTHQGAVVGTGTMQGTLYVQISADGLMVGGGCYRMARDQLARYRAAVEDDATGAPLVALVADLRAQGFELAGECLRRAPRGVDPAHPRVDLLKHKGIAALVHHGSPRWLSTPKALDRVAQGWRAIAPFNAWLGAHVGPAQPLEDGRAPARRGANPRGAGL
jgi:uncharacterized protein (TIGR02453 family)